MKNQLEIIEDTEISVEDFEIKDPVTYERVNTLKQKIDETGIVSREEVLSLENFIGTDIVTSMVQKNKLVMGGSSLYADVCSKRLDKFLETYNEEDHIISLTMVMNNLNNVIDHAERIMNVSSVSNIDVDLDKLNRLKNEKYTLKWKDDKVINVYETMGVDEVLMWEDKYLQAVLESDDDFDFIRRKFNTNKSKLTPPFLLLDVLVHGKVDEFLSKHLDYIPVEEITIKEVTESLLDNKIYESGKNILNKSINILENLNFEINREEEIHQDYLKNINAEVMNIHNLLNDINSYNIIYCVRLLVKK